MQHRAPKRLGARRTGTVLVLSALAVPAISGTSSAASETSGKPSSGSSSRHTATPSERELARAGVVKYDDLPSWSVTTEPEDSNSLNEAQACPGERVVRYVAGNTSTAFKGSKAIFSSSMVVDSTKDAEYELRWLKSAAGIKCLRDEGSTTVGSASGTLTAGLSAGSPAPGSTDGSTGDFTESMSVKRIHVDVPGADDLAAFRISSSITFQGVTMKGVSYLIDARVGRTELAIYTSAEHAPSLSQAKELLHKVVGRVGDV